MAVTGVGSATNTNNQGAASQDVPATSLDYTAFLRLLLAQLKNQDPTQPMDSTAYMGQLASFSNVEQGIKMNAKLDSMLTAFSLSQADGVIGRNIATADGSVSGKCVSVAIFSDGVVATLEGGQRLMLGPGIVITEPENSAA
jgi:flagellar basal-body rod modification protein FlgD